MRTSLISTFEVYGKDKQTNNNKTKQKQNTKQNKTKQNKNKKQKKTPLAVLEIDLLNRNEYSLFTNWLPSLAILLPYMGIYYNQFLGLAI